MTSTSSTFLPLLIAFGGLFLGAIFILIGWYLWYEGRELRTNGRTVTAIVKEKFRKVDQDLLGQLENYYIRCVFQDTTGLLQEVEVSLQSKRWYQVSEGKTTQLTYVPDDLDETLPGSRFGWQVRGVIGIALMALGVLSTAVISVGAFQEWLRT